MRLSQTLPLNTAAYAALSRKHQLLLGAAPVLLMFAPFLLLLPAAHWLDSPAAAAYNPFANGSAFPVVWAVLALLLTLAAMLLGNALGWLLNAAWCRWALAWPPAQLRAVFLRAELPAHWYRTGIGSLAEAEAQAARAETELRRGGALRFILLRGVLAWGGPMFVFMVLLPALIGEQSLSLRSVAVGLLVWGISGAGFGAAMWLFSAGARKR